MIRFLALLLCFAASSAFGQAAVRQSGPATAGHLPVYTANGMIADAGTGVLIGTTGSIGGSALSAGVCTSGTATVTGVASTMAVVVSPSSNPLLIYIQGLAIWGYVSATDTVTVEVCAIVATTPAATTYNVRLIE